jgi:hypothetical protein
MLLEGDVAWVLGAQRLLWMLVQSLKHHVESTQGHEHDSRVALPHVDPVSEWGEDVLASSCTTSIEG